MLLSNDPGAIISSSDPGESVGSECAGGEVVHIIPADPAFH